MSHHHHHHGHCSHEANDEDHDHHDHDHDDGPDRGMEFSLYQHIDLDKVRCLNESQDGSAKYIFKPWNLRLDNAKVWNIP
jgi:hypothetical protein